MYRVAVVNSLSSGKHFTLEQLSVMHSVSAIHPHPILCHCGTIVCTIHLSMLVHSSHLQITSPVPMKGRCHHSITATSLGPGLTEVLVFGGSRQLYGNPIAETTILRFGTDRSRYLTLHKIITSDVGKGCFSPGRISACTSNVTKLGLQVTVC